jgi:GntR family transcriptional regulator
MTDVKPLLRRDSQIALYRQLKDWILGEIERGVWDPGSLLPSERALVADVGVSRITVRQALRELVQEGVLESVPGKGFFVSERPLFPLHGLVSLTSLAKERGWKLSNRVLAAQQIPASAGLARALELDVGVPLLHLARVRVIDDAPVNVQRLWLPERRCRGLLDEDLSRASVFALLTGRFGIELARADITISARPAEVEEQELLELPEGAAVLTVDQITRDRGGEPVEFTISAHHPGRFPVSLTQERPRKSWMHDGGADTRN